MDRTDRLRDRVRRYYEGLAQSSESAARRTGRYELDEPLNANVWRDLWDKLKPCRGHSVLDIGCGCGFLAEQLASEAQNLDIRVTFVDFPAVIERLKMELVDRSISLDSMAFVSGPFPDDFPMQSGRFDRIVMYDSIQYTENPNDMVDAAVQLLAPGGRFLIGDIPNLSRKGRFLSTPSGRRFEARYRGVALEEIAVYADHREFVRKNAQANAYPIDDDWVLDILRRYRDQGLDVYVLEQFDGLPFNRTREDLLIVSPDFC